MVCLLPNYKLKVILTFSKKSFSKEDCIAMGIMAQSMPYRCLKPKSRDTEELSNDKDTSYPFEGLKCMVLHCLECSKLK